MNQRRWWQQDAVRTGVLVFLAARLLLTLWAGVTVSLLPPPTTPDEMVRPYLGEPQLHQGAAALLLGPWQRFDTQHYARLARDGYADAADSVFPPLYPLLIRIGAALLGGGAAARLAAGLLVANLAALALLILLHHVAAAELGPAAATRTLVYLVLFPTGFFLFAAYSESLFLLLALASVWAGRRGRFWPAGVLGALAALTRLTGWVLVVPLAYELGRRHLGADQTNAPAGAGRLWRDPRLLAVALPGLALVGFLALRWRLGLPPLADVYAGYWYQRTGIPGQDLLAAANTLFLGGIPRRTELLSLSLDFASALLLLATTAAAFRRLGVTYGLYALPLLFFILLPTSAVKPIYSFSRYALAFFPTFMLLASWGARPWIHRLILYPSLAALLFFSGQFFIWGWVA